MVQGTLFNLIQADTGGLVMNTLQAVMLGCKEWPQLKPVHRGIKPGEILFSGCGSGGRGMGYLSYELTDVPDEVLHCTGTVTEYEINELKKRIASGMTTADDVVLLDKVLEYAKIHTAKGDS